MISVTEAQEIIFDNIAVLPAKDIDTGGSLGYALAEDIVSDDDIPAFDNAAMDGFAVRAADTAGASRACPAVLAVAHEIPAGTPADKPLEPGQAFRIMTGGMIPSGADAVVMVEDTDSGGGSVKIYAPTESGQHIRPAGDDIRRGEKILSRGDAVTPAAMGILASAGRTRVRVHRTPRAAFFTTGNELVEPEEEPAPGKVRNANRYSLSGLLQSDGAASAFLGNAADTLHGISGKIAEGRAADVLITSGAVSVGKYDFVKEALEGEGMTTHFWRVAQRPGKPLLFGTFPGGTPVFGLPGNPVSVMVSYIMYVRPALRKMMGFREYRHRTVPARLAAPFKKLKSLTFFTRGTYRVEDGAFWATPLEKQSSGVLQSMSRAGCLIIFEKGKETFHAGAPVEMLLLP